MGDINRLKLVLVEQKRTSKWLAEQLGVNPSTVSKWCTNTSQPPLETLIQIAQHLGVTIQDLLRDTVQTQGVKGNYNGKTKIHRLVRRIRRISFSLREIGLRMCFASEIQPELQSLYERNFGMKCSGDINEIDITKISQTTISFALVFPVNLSRKQGSNKDLMTKKKRKPFL